jgi:hypothetical protein
MDIIQRSQRKRNNTATTRRKAGTILSPKHGVILKGHCRPGMDHREKWMITESNFITFQGILNHMLGNFPFWATIPLIFRVVDQRHHKRLQDHTHIQCAGRTSTA